MLSSLYGFSINESEKGEKLRWEIPAENRANQGVDDG